MLDRRLAEIVLKKVDVSYGGENGFNQAIALSADALSNVKFIQERELINRYFDEINQDTGKFCFGVKDTMTVRHTRAAVLAVLHHHRCPSALASLLTGLTCGGLVAQACEMSAVETLLVWEDLPTMRYHLRNNSTGGEYALPASRSTPHVHGSHSVQGAATRASVRLAVGT